MSATTHSPAGTDAGFVRRLLADPSWFLRDVEPLRRQALFSPMSESSYRESSFLDNRIVRAGGDDRITNLDALLDRLRPESASPPACHYLFHIGHCGSTLLSRCLGESGKFFALREPPMLMGLARSARFLGEPGFPVARTDWARLAALAALMLSRTWREGQAALVKPTSHANNLITHLMGATGLERAVFLYVDLPDYLATMLRPSVRRETRLFARDVRLHDLRARVADHGVSTGELGDPELAAMTWLLHAKEYAEALANPDIGRRVRLLHFNTFLATPRATLESLAAHLDPAGEPLDDSSLERALGWLSVSAKDPAAPHGADRRRDMLAASRSENAAAIEAGLAYARELAALPPFGGLSDQFGPATS